METLKQSISKKKLSKNNKKSTDSKSIFVFEKSELMKYKSRNSNPVKVISIAWRKAERLDNQLRKIML